MRNPPHILNKKTRIRIIIIGTTPGTKRADIYETKAYGTAQNAETLNLEKFAQQITSNGCAYDRTEVQTILTKSVALEKWRSTASA